MKVALLGGGGFIGSAASRKFHAAGHTVTEFRRSASSGTPSETIQGDRYDRTSLDSLADDGFDVVVDFLCYQAEHAQQLRAAFKGKTSKVVMISTGSVYWATGTWQNPVNEDQFARTPVGMMEELLPTPLTPGSVEYSYGLGKRQAEYVLNAAQEASEFDVVRLRFPVVGGPDDPTGRYAGYVVRLMDGGPLLIPDGGFNSFRHVYVEDAAAAIVASVEHSGPGSAWNIASRETLSVRDLVREMANCLGLPEPQVVGPSRAWLAQQDHAGLFAPFSALRDQVLDIRAAENELDFTPTPWAEWLARTVSGLEALPQPAQRAHELETIRHFERTLDGALAYLDAGEMS